MKKDEEIKGQQGSCKSCLPCLIAVVLDFDQRLLGNKYKTNNKKEMGKIRHFNFWGPKPPGPKWKRAETSGGQIRKGPKPLATFELVARKEGSQLCKTTEKWNAYKDIS